MLSMLGKNYNREQFETLFFLCFPENRLMFHANCLLRGNGLTFHAKCLLRDILNDMPKPFFFPREQKNEKY